MVDRSATLAACAAPRHGSFALWQVALSISGRTCCARTPFETGCQYAYREHSAVIADILNSVFLLFYCNKCLQSPNVARSVHLAVVISFCFFFVGTSNNIGYSL
uniref:Uncharacterized protein n=1 Tax=Ixodes ricinus TaxID=34613 RepID=A0A6B0UFT2_IXORI